MLILFNSSIYCAKKVFFIAQLNVTITEEMSVTRYWELYMTALQFSNVPIYSGSHLNLPRLVDAYGVTRKAFSEMSDVSESTLSRKGEVKASTRIKLGELISIYTLLWKLLEGNEASIKRWLHESQDQYFGLSPIQFMKLDKNNIQTVLKNLQEIRYGEAMGA